MNDTPPTSASTHGKRAMDNLASLKPDVATGQMEAEVEAVRPPLNISRSSTAPEAD
jgi:hypothetical protein